MLINLMAGLLLAAEAAAEAAVLVTAVKIERRCRRLDRIRGWR